MDEHNLPGGCYAQGDSLAHPTRLSPCVSSGSDSGGHTDAVLRSFTGSCQLIGVEPFAWFRDVLARINSHPINRLHELLPHHWAAARA